jgi:hypothetical protein
MANFDNARLVMGNRKRGLLLSFKGYLFSKNRERIEKTYWRCIESTCAVMMHTNVFVKERNRHVNIVVLKEPPRHSHAPCDASIAQRDMIQEMIDVVEADPCGTITSAYNIVTTRSHNARMPQSVPTFGAVESVLRRRRRECFPEIPHQLADVDISGEWAVTWSDKRHLSLLDNNWGVVTFMTRENAKILIQCDTVFVDGTFRTAPHPYVQLITIHGLFRGVVVPLVFSLVSGKNTGQYRQILQHISNQVTALFNRQWRPVNIVCDFEVALITALETELPRSRIRACYFHFTQSLLRKAASLGLTNQYRGSRRVRKIVQKMMAIGFLPSLLVSRAFQVYGYLLLNRAFLS